MQKEALERLREMQRRSKTIVEPSSYISNMRPESSDAGAQNQKEVRNLHTNPTSDIIKSILGDGIKLDSEKLLILMMLYVLYKNKADAKLLLALGYLLL